MKAGLLIFCEFEHDDVFTSLSALIRKTVCGDGERVQEDVSRYRGAACRMIDAAERMGVEGNVWQTWIASLFARTETMFSLTHERSERAAGTLSDLAKEDLDLLHYYFNFDLSQIDEYLGISLFGRLRHYHPLSAGKDDFDRRSGLIVNELVDALRGSRDKEGFFNELLRFHRVRGSGRYALNKAFRWDAEKREIIPVTHTEEIMLSGLVGYEEQKKVLMDNTAAFVEGRPANNVLLYGESGTGKSSTVKALLNEFEADGLRMVEVYKHQIQDFDLIVDLIKRRNYKFIIFMDDLSFEKFEIEYKYLKSCIEGGLEKRPANILIYATSNRRHLMKESWSEREESYDDVHISETMQERMSLVDRFGLKIRYFSPEQEEYLNIVSVLAKEYGVDLTEEELAAGAIRWELRHGGFSGRAARQFVEHIAGRKR